ncbi:hypothetical protein ACROYT_G014213 [Oculina patagonica]
MKLDVDGSPSSDRPWSLARVTGKDLDPEKHWYVLSSSLCGVKPGRFAKSDIFKRFPEEICSVQPADLKPTKRGCSFNMQPSKLFVASSFGLFPALLRQRDSAADGFLRSSKFIPVVDAVNRIALDECKEKPRCSFGGKSFDSNQGSPELQKLNSKITELGEQIKNLEKTNEFLSSFLPLSSPLATSSPSHLNESSNSNTSGTRNNSDSGCGSNTSLIEETLKSNSIDPTVKKRKVAKECRKVTEELDGVLAKYHESLACVLGNTFLYGGSEEKQKVSETLSEIVNLVMDTKGTKKGLTELLLPETYLRLLHSMKVPDWVLLYFKLQGRLPDAGWQTLLNLTKLGKSRGKSDAAAKMDTDFHAYGVDLESVLVWAIREQRLLTEDLSNSMKFNIKLDGRPLGGRKQVAVGIVPINFVNKSSQSALSVYPVALNEQKAKIKKTGVVVDGRKYNIKFTATTAEMSTQTAKQWKSAPEPPYITPIKPQSINFYLGGVRSLHVSNGHDNPLTPGPRLKQTLRGIEPKLAPPKRKMLITFDLLCKIHPFMNFCSNDDIVYWAAITCGHFLLLRAREFTLRNKERFDPSRNLALGDITSQQSPDGQHYWMVYIKQAKTAQ